MSFGHVSKIGCVKVHIADKDASCELTRNEKIDECRIGIPQILIVWTYAAEHSARLVNNHIERPKYTFFISPTSVYLALWM